jgi:hypothetical protein
MDSLAAKGLVDPLDLLDQLETLDPRDLLEPPEFLDPLPPPLRDALVLLDAPDLVVALASLVALETMAAPDPLDPRATVEPQDSLAALARMELLESLEFLAPPEAATTAHQPVWPLGTKRRESADWPRNSSAFFLVFIVWFCWQRSQNNSTIAVV